MHMQLIGSNTCPFVQRCLILLYQNKIDFQMVLIDLLNKPDWFNKISPTGKVPILKVNDCYIFESLIINEFINERYNLNLQETDILQKAINKSWSEFSSSLISMQYSLICASDHTKYQSNINTLIHGLKWLEHANITLPYFNGSIFSLIDIAFAPLFYRIGILNEIYKIDLLFDTPKLKTWKDNLLTHEAIVNSIPPNYKNLILTNIQNKNSFITKMNSISTSE